jgi:hypothetical protein
MVNIQLPIEVVVGSFDSSIEVLGIESTYVDQPLQLLTTLSNTISNLRSILQFKEGVPQDTVNVGILNRPLFISVLGEIFADNDFITNTSVEQVFLDHVSEALAGELTKVLGLNAARSLVYITPTQTVFTKLAEALVKALEDSADLRQYLYEQFLRQSPERFQPGPDADWAPIPFETGDSLSFYIRFTFTHTCINGDPTMPLSRFIPANEMPTTRFIVIFNLES